MIGCHTAKNRCCVIVDQRACIVVRGTTQPPRLFEASRRGREESRAGALQENDNAAGLRTFD